MFMTQKSDFLSQFTPYSFPLLGLVRLPSIVISDEDKKEAGVKPDATNINFLKRLCFNSYKVLRATGKFNGITEKDVFDRLKFEFDVLDKTGTIDYILMFWDLVKWCKKNDIPVGPGRGSVCGSLVCYLAGITRINSLQYNLNFTRFISEARVKPKMVNGVMYADGRTMCDIDSDFSKARRKDIQAYIDTKYPQRSAHICSFTTLSGKTALKDVLKIYLEWNEDQAKAVSDLIEVRFGKTDKLEDAFEKSKEYREWVERAPEHLEAHRLACSLQGIITNKGVHASGLFLSYAPLDETLPTELITDKEDQEHISTSYDMDAVAEIGCKLDILSLKTLDVIKEACKLSNVVEEEIDIEHKSIYDFLAKSRYYYGLFQIETGLAGDTTHKAKPKNIRQLSACISIARPGALKDIPTLVEYYETGRLKSIHPQFDTILKDTANVIIYQESINDICQQVYDINAVDAEEVSRAIRKKKRSDIAKWESAIVKQGDKLAIPKDVTEQFWATCNTSADYLFSVNHGLPYSVLAAETTYLKVNGMKEFYLATLKFAHKTEMSLIIAEARKLGVDVLPPNLIKSQDDFIFEGNNIRFGLRHIKGIAGANLGKVTSFRREFDNKFEIFDFAKQLGIPINVLETLVLCGAIDWPSTNRIRLAMEARCYNLLSDKKPGPIIKKLAKEFNYDLMATVEGLKTRQDEKGKPLLKESVLDTWRRNIAPYWENYQNNMRNEGFALYIAERNLLGFSYSNTLFNLFSSKVDGLVPVGEAAQEPKGIEVSFVCFVDKVYKGVGRKSKKPYLRWELSDESGNVKAMLNGNDKIQGCVEFNGRMPDVDDIIIVHGKTGDDGMVFGDSAIIQESPVKLKRDKEDRKPVEETA